MGEECKGGKAIQPMSQERLHGGAKQGRASVTGSPDRCGMQSLIGAIDPPRLRRYFLGYPIRALIFTIPQEEMFAFIRDVSRKNSQPLFNPAAPVKPQDLKMLDPFKVPKKQSDYNSNYNSS